MTTITTWKKILERNIELVGGELQVELVGFLFRGLVGSITSEHNVLIFNLLGSVQKRKDSIDGGWSSAGKDTQYSVIEGSQVEEESDGILKFYMDKVGPAIFFPQGTTTETS